VSRRAVKGCKGREAKKKKKNVDSLVSIKSLYNLGREMGIRVGYKGDAEWQTSMGKRSPVKGGIDTKKGGGYTV